MKIKRTPTTALLHKLAPTVMMALALTALCLRPTPGAASSTAGGAGGQQSTGYWVSVAGGVYATQGVPYETVAWSVIASGATTTTTIPVPPPVLILTPGGVLYLTPTEFVGPTNVFVTTGTAPTGAMLGLFGDAYLTTAYPIG